MAFFSFLFLLGGFSTVFFFYFFIIIINWKLIGLCFLKVILKRFKFFNFLICLLIVFLKRFKIHIHLQNTKQGKKNHKHTIDLFLPFFIYFFLFHGLSVDG